MSPETNEQGVEGVEGFHPPRGQIGVKSTDLQRERLTFQIGPAPALRGGGWKLPPFHPFARSLRLPGMFIGVAV